MSLVGGVCRLAENPWRSWSTNSFYRSRSFVALFTSAPHSRHADCFPPMLLLQDQSRLFPLASTKFWCLMPWAVSRRPFKAKVLVQSQASATEVCWTPSGDGTGCSPSTSVFACQYHSANAAHSFSHLLRWWLASEEWRLNWREGEKFILFTKRPHLSRWKTASCSMVQYQEQSGRSRKHAKYTYVRTSGPSEAMLD